MYTYIFVCVCVRFVYLVGCSILKRSIAITGTFLKVEFIISAYYIKVGSRFLKLLSTEFVLTCSLPGGWSDMEALLQA